MKWNKFKLKKINFKSHFLSQKLIFSCLKKNISKKTRFFFLLSFTWTFRTSGTWKIAEHDKSTTLWILTSEERERERDRDRVWVWAELSRLFPLLQIKTIWHVTIGFKTPLLHMNKQYCNCLEYLKIRFYCEVGGGYEVHVMCEPRTA